MATHENPDRALERLARRQHGAFNHRQAIALGFSNKMIHSRVSSGIWLRLAPGIYALASAPSSWRRQYKAAELTHPDAAIAGLSAAKLQAIDGFRTVGPEIMVPYTCKTRSPIARIHRARDVPTTTIDGIRVTTIAQTLFDLLSRINLDRLERAIDGQILGGRVSVEALRARRDATRSTSVAVPALASGGCWWRNAQLTGGCARKVISSRCCGRCSPGYPANPHFSDRQPCPGGSRAKGASMD